MNKVTEYLNKFASIADQRFIEIEPFLEDFYLFFENFLKRENLEKAEWADFQEMGNHIHSFNAMALAKSKALGRPNHPIQHYRDVFIYLVYGDDPINIRINNVLEGGKYVLRNFGKSTLSEIMGHAFSDKYVFYNRRDVKAANFLGIEINFARGDKEGDKFLKFNEAIKPVVDQYIQIVGKRTDTTIPLEVDQFFSWLYENFIRGKEEVSEPKPVYSKKTFWIYSPGERASMWEEFYDRGIMGLGWDEIGDYSKYKTQEEIAVKLRELEGTDSSKCNDSRACYEFANVIKPGDIIIPKRGRAAYLGYGIVKSDYIFDPSEDHYQSIRQVEWKKKGDWPEREGSIVLKTLTNISYYPDYVERLKTLIGIEGEAVSEFADNKEISYWWLNANLTHWDVENLEVGVEESYTSRNKTGNKRRIYEYFKKVKPGDLIIGYKTAPVKKVILIFEVTEGLHVDDDGDEVFSFHVKENVVNQVDWETMKSTPGLQDCEVFKNNQGSLFMLTKDEFQTIVELTKGPTPFEIEVYDKALALDELFINESQLNAILASLNYKKNIILQGPPGTGKTFIAKRLAYIDIGGKDKSKIEMIQFHQSYAYEDFIQGYRPNDDGRFELKNGVFYKFCRKAERDPDHNYYFIIDEINRGNLSKIFGELMMLIEYDKRGAEFAIPLTYSKTEEQRFFIPENIFIIGTMNTADRSLALVDYALRRRFSFISLQAEFGRKFQSFLKTKKVPSKFIDRILNNMTNLNKHIANDPNLGKGFIIGHSYFCNIPSKPDDSWYDQIITNEIDPLIREYWFDDEAKANENIKLVKS